MTATEGARAALIDAADALTPDEVHQHPFAALDKIRGLTRELRALIAEHERIRGWLEEQKLGGRFGALPQFLLRVLDGEERLAVGGEGVGHEGIPGHSIQQRESEESGMTMTLTEAIERARRISFTLTDAENREAFDLVLEAARRQGQITDAMVEASAERFWLAGHPCEAWPPSNDEPDFLAERYRTAARAALEAAERGR